MIKKIFQLILMSLLILSTFSCSVNNESKAVSESAASNFAMVADGASNGFARVNAKMAAQSAAPEASNDGVSDTDNARKIVKEVSINAETKNFDESIKWVKSHVGTFNGIISSSYADLGNKSDIKYRKSANFELKIPAEKLDAFLNKIGTNLNVTYQQENVQDITDTYDDTQIRLKALQIEQAKLTDLLAKAQTVDEMIKIEEKLADVGREIQSITIKINKMDDRVAYATVTIYITEVKDLTEKIEVDDFSKENLMKQLKINYEKTKKFVIGIGVYLFTHIPNIILVLSVILIILILIVIIRVIFFPYEDKKSTKTGTKTGIKTGTKTETKAETKIETKAETKKEAVASPKVVSKKDVKAKVEKPIV